MEPYFVKSKRGGDILVYKGFMYHKRYDRRSKTYWNCIKKSGCNATAITNHNPLVILYAGTHKHAPSKERVECAEILNKIKKQARDHPELPISQIITSELRSLSGDVLIHLPDTGTIRRSLTRQRQFKFRDCSKNLSDLEELPREYNFLSTKEQFLFYDNCDEENASRILIYATRNNLWRLSQSTTWFLSGTFTINPATHALVFTVLGVYCNHIFPFVYALLDCKAEDTYETILRQIKLRSKELGISFPDPEIIISDNDSMIIEAQENIFPNAKTALSFFHFKQDILAVTQQEGLQSEFMDPNTDYIHKAVYQLICLAFVPLDDIFLCFDILLTVLPDNVLDLANYVEETYIRGKVDIVDKYRIIPPKYPPTLWNLYEAARNGETRINNLIEEWQNHFQKVIGKHHPTLHHLIKEIFKEQSNTDVLVTLAEEGHRVKTPQKMKNRRIMQHLQKMALSYDEYVEDCSIPDYLRTCGHIFSL